MIGKVEVWQMTEEEILAYINKHPIRPIKRPNGSTFAMTQEKVVESHKKARKRRWANGGFL